MVKLADVPYKTDFYWNGKRYKQLLRPKGVEGDFIVVCSPRLKPDDDWIDISSYAEVKPCIRLED